MPWTEAKEGQRAVHAATIWRTLIIVALVLASVSIALSAVLYAHNNDAAARTQALACRIGSFLVGAPVARQPGQTKKVFDEELAKAAEFLKALRSADCTSVRGAAITRGQINRQIRHYHHAAQASGGSPGSTANTAPAAPSTAPSAPTAKVPAPGPAPAPTSAPAPTPRPSPGGGGSGGGSGGGGGGSGGGGGGRGPPPPPGNPPPILDTCQLHPTLPVCVSVGQPGGGLHLGIHGVTGPDGVLP